jgi:branched-chain amino acid transport system substrate-binding protein
MDRRRFLRQAGLTATGLTAAGVLSACTSQAQTVGPKPIKILFVSPETGSLAAFGAPNGFVLAGIRDYLKKHGVTVAGTRHDVTIVTQDTQSSDDLEANAKLAEQLIFWDQPDLVLATGHGRTVIPIAGAAESAGCPCITSLVPWEVWLSRQPNPKWARHFNWGRATLLSTFTDMWRQVPTNKVVGELLGSDTEGTALATPAGFPATIKALKYGLVDPGRDKGTTTDFSPFIARLKSGEAQILAGAGGPKIIGAFLRQARQQGYAPRVLTWAEGLEFGTDVAKLGDLANNLGCEVWWAPQFPYTSSLTGQTAAQLAAAFTAATGKPWLQSLGYAHALFEIAIAALNGARALDPTSIVASISSLQLDTVVGNVDWVHGPAKGVATTPLVGGQWRVQPGQPPELAIVTNGSYHDIPVGGKVQPIA